MNLNEYTPKLITVIKKGLTGKEILSDVISGFIVGIIALPLAIAFSIASGVSPEKGIITAILAGFIISAFGGSRVQIGGPTGAFVIIISGIILKHGINGLILATFMAGIIMIIMGILKLGDLLKFVPHTLIAGFTTGIAVIIFSTQIKDFFGLRMESVPSEFIPKWISYFKNINSLNLWAMGIGLLTIGIIILFQKLKIKFPGSLVAIIVTTALVFFFKLPVETIFTKFGDIKASFSLPSLPEFSLETIKPLVLPAVSIALLGSIESLLSAVVSDSMTGGKHRSNMELIAQGGANMVSALFGGIPATGAIARTAANVKNGGKTPIAGMVHALTLLLILLVASPLSKHIPLASLAGILIVVAWNMSEIREFTRIFKVNIYEVLVLLTTFILTVFFDLTLAILIGFVLSVILFMKRMSTATEISPLMGTKTREDELFQYTEKDLPEGTLVYEINGPLFFASVSSLLNIEKTYHQDYKTLILRMRYVPIIDTTGLKRLKGISREMTRKNRTLIITGAADNIQKKLISQNILGKDFLFPTFQSALETLK